MSSPEYIPPSENLQSAVDAIGEAWDAICRTNVAFRRGIGNDGHPGHKVMSLLFDHLEAAKSLIVREKMHHARQELSLKEDDSSIVMES